MTPFISIGLGNVIMKHRIVSIDRADPSAVKRILKLARDSGKLIDTTMGRRTRSVLVTDSGHVVTSSLQPDTLRTRINEAASS